MADVSEFTVPPDADLKTAMASINENGRRTAFIVDDDGRLLGSVTDGDIRRGILAGTSLSASVTSVMNSDPLTGSKDESDRSLRDRVAQTVGGGVGSVVIPITDTAGIMEDVRGISTEVHETLSTSRSHPVDGVAVIGGAGYLGAVLSRQLLDAGYEVVILDRLLFGTTGIDAIIDDPHLTLIEGDMRHIEAVVDAVRQVDAVIHLGGLVGDPASAVDAEETLEQNLHATRLIATIAKYHQVSRFIFASTCSVYGHAEDPETLLDEEAPLHPVSLYAQTNIQSEQVLAELSDATFAPTILRMATLYGLSPRMRFDLVVNILTAKAHHEGVIPIHGGSQFRPNLHVRDAARAYVVMLEAPFEAVANEVFNVGTNEQNHAIIEIGEIVQTVLPEADLQVDATSDDPRSYQVDFGKIHEQTHFETRETIAGGVTEIAEALHDGRFTDYTDMRYNNYRMTLAALDD